MVLLAVMSAVVAACSGGAQTGEDEAALNGPGRWTPPADVLAIGARARLEYDAAPRWTGASGCTGKLRNGSRRLGEYLRDNFEVIRSVGGYACRRNTADGSRMSVHGTGRALDVFIPTKNGAADNLHGDKVANFLIVNAQRIGVQLIIWDRSVWRANGTNTGPYGGPHPHDDHIHVELTDEGGAATTPWFSEMTPFDGGASDDDDAGATTDAGATRDAATATDAGTTEPPADAGTTTPDAGAATPDAGGSQPTEPTPDAGGTGGEGEGSVTPDGPPSSGEPPPGTGFELPEGDEPDERDSLGGGSPSRKIPRSSDDDVPMPSAGCSAAAGGSAPPATALALGAMVLALGLVSRRRRS